MKKGGQSSFSRAAKVVYVDMDFVLCDFMATHLEYQALYPDLEFTHSKPGFFLDLNPIEGAIAGFQWLMDSPYFDPYILTAPSVRNAHCYTEKRLWVEKHLGMPATYRLIISPNKALNVGDFLIDDNIKGKGQDGFTGTLIHFGSDGYPDWDAVISFLESQARLNRTRRAKRSLTLGTFSGWMDDIL